MIRSVLAGEECWNLADVRDLSSSLNLGHAVDIGEHREAEVVAHSAKHTESLVDAGSAIGGRRGPIGFVVRRFENVGNVKASCECADCFSHLEGVGFTFDDTGPGDQEELPRAEIYVCDLKGFDRGRHR